MKRSEIRNHECFMVPKHIFHRERAELERKRRNGDAYTISTYPNYDAFLGDENPHINMLVEQTWFLPNRYYFITIDGVDCFLQGFHRGNAVFYAGKPACWQRYERSRTEVMNDGTVRIVYV